MDNFRIQYFELLDVLMNEFKRRFQQKRGIPIAALIEKTLIDHSNENSNLMSNLEMYKNNLDIGRLSIQLRMLADLIKTRNMNVPSSS